MSNIKTGTRFDDPSNGLQVIGFVGAGASGKAFLCKSEDNFYILKLFIGIDEQSGKDKFIQEGENTRKLGINTSPYVIAIGGKDDGYDLLANEPPFLILDYVPGITLHDFLELVRGDGEKPKEIDDLVKYKIIFGIAQSLNLIHRKGGVHRDIKPANIFLDQDFNPHIGDFGEATEKKYTINLHGTINFIPPEACQPEGHKIPCSPPYDVYEFGSTLFQIITYEWPFNNMEDSDILETLTSKGERDNRVESGEISLNEKDKPLYEIVKMCWNQDPNERPTMDDISHWIYDAAPGILGDDFDKFNEYACSIGDDICLVGTTENVHKAIANGFAESNEQLRKVAEQDGIPIGNLIDGVHGVSEYRNRPPTKSKRI